MNAYAAMTERIVQGSMDTVRIEARLREYTDHSIERAPAVVAWWKESASASASRPAAAFHDPVPTPIRRQLDDIAVWLETR